MDSSYDNLLKEDIGDFDDDIDDDLLSDYLNEDNIYINLEISSSIKNFYKSVDVKMNLAKSLEDAALLGKNEMAETTEIINKVTNFADIIMETLQVINSIPPQTNLLELLKRIQKSRAIDRVRLSSVEPLELTENIIHFVSQSGLGSGHVCQHFHIPLQSGDNPILKRMNRPYTRELFRNLILRIHERVPDAAIGVDTLIGFPGESNPAFENTYALIEELPVSYLHVFPFSPRKGTPAYDFPDKVQNNIIKARCQKMRALGNIKKKTFYKRFIGKSVEVLIESKRDKKTGMVWGKTSNYIPVLIRGEGISANTMVQARIMGLNDDHSVFATIC